MSEAAAANPRWLAGPTTDLLFGCGVLYMGVFAVLALVGAPVQDLLPPAVPILLTLMFSAPHYGATLLRVYENPADRRKYSFFTLHVTVAILGLFLVGLHSIAAASWLLTIYLTWSPWHYTGQNYGLAVMFLRRRGVPIEGGTKKLLYASFILSYVVLLLVMWTGPEAGADVARSYGPVGHERIRVQRYGIPGSVGLVGLPIAAVAYVASTLLAFGQLARRSRARDLLPSALLAITQALWFSIPMLARATGVGTNLYPLSPDARTDIFVWIALGHSVQYLWVTTYFARSTAEWQGRAEYWLKVAAAGTALWTLPLVVFAPWSLGSMSGDAGFYPLLAACINIHHFALDGAIWKLRDSRVARALLREPVLASPTQLLGGGGLRRAIWSVAAVGAALAIVQFQFESELASADQADPARVSSALDGLAWFGRDSATVRRQIMKSQLEAGEVEAAIASLRKSIVLEPDVDGYSKLARLESRRGRSDAALEALEDGLRLDPDRLGLLYRAGEAELAAGRPGRARVHLERALSVDPAHAPSQRALLRAKAMLAPLPRG